MPWKNATTGTIAVVFEVWNKHWAFAQFTAVELIVAVKNKLPVNERPDGSKNTIAIC
jgi:glycyl-tRNA synthetase alpha subunit